MKCLRFTNILLCGLVLLVGCSSGSGSKENENKNVKANGKESANRSTDPNMREDPGESLGSRFLKALQDDDVDEFVACWLSVKELESILDNADEGTELPPKEQLEQMKPMFEKRDNFIRTAFPILRKGLVDKCGDLSKMKVKKVSPIAIQERDLMDQASSIDLVFETADGGVVKLNVDDAALGKTKWYLSDIPDTVFEFTASDGTKKSIDLHDFASEDEKKKLQEYSAIPGGEKRKR